MNAAEVHRWIAGFEAAADRQALAERGSDPSWAIRMSLSMIEAAWAAGWRPWAADPAREADVEPVRAAWVKVRERSAR
jgi:hypothetical protein